MKFEEDEEEETAANPTEPTEPMLAEPAQDLPLLRRSNRQIKPPVRFSDYVRIVYLK